MIGSSSAIGPRFFPVIPSYYRIQKPLLHETPRTQLPNTYPTAGPADRMDSPSRQAVLNTSIAYWAPLISSREVFMRQRKEEEQAHYSLAL